MLYTAWGKGAEVIENIININEIISLNDEDFLIHCSKGFEDYSLVITKTAMNAMLKAFKFDNTSEFDGMAVVGIFLKKDNAITLIGISYGGA